MTDTTGLPPGCKPLTPEDEADLRLLSFANEKGKFGLDLRGISEPAIQFAFERGIDGEWFTLVDVGPIAHSAALMRIFRLTAAGRKRLVNLRLYDAAPEPVKPREWWGVHKADGNHKWLVAHPDRAQVRNMYPSADIVRLIEAPEDQA